ncbi:ABC-2 type transport system permease protein [Haladaptatus litoreus]|uniref:ABC-2 type transport system permease protein n=1 Tax=Haladaptatus litoreus TaxID=553468 RepID=A0A1N7CXY3_9EURY|nr:ABC transporter permease subunit [Haladaptatus litoreus]SIR68400.1 ABC-2 type transport system permease protein [Haladaptatus litoreus]
MFEITQFETTKRVRGTLILTVALVMLIALTVGLFPSIESAGIDLDAYIESLPEETRRAFIGNVTTITTIEGYLASQFYQLAWLLVLGVYYAYAAASSVASEVENRTLELVLAHSVSRSQLVVGKFFALVPSMIAVNALSYLAVYGGVRYIDEVIDPMDLFALHAYSIGYLLACAALGMVASVVFDTARRAQMVAIGSVFGMFIIDSFTFDTDYEWVGDFAFTRYYDVGEILTEGTVAWSDLALLIVSAVLLLIVSAELFERKDV